MEILIDLLKTTPLASTVIGSYFWIRRNVWSSHISIVNMASTTYAGYNKSLAEELAGQKADSSVASIYIVLSVFSQAILNFIPTPTLWGYSQIFRIKHILLFLILCVVLYFLGNIFSRLMEKEIIKKIQTHLNNEKH